MAKTKGGKTNRVTRGSSNDRQSRRSLPGKGAKRASSMSPHPGPSKKSCGSKRRISVSPYPDKAKNGKRVRFDRNNENSAEKNNPPEEPEPPITVKIRMFQGKPGDSYCWICHAMTDEYFCQRCPRTYHNQCLKKIKFSQSEPICECQWTSVDGPKSKSNITVDLRDLLQIVLKKVIDEKNNKKSKDANTDYMTYLRVWPEFKENEHLWEQIDITFIIDKLKLSAYKNTNEFFQDVKWITHNCHIVKGSDDIMTVTAQKFEKSIKLQLSDMEACGECYLEKSADYPSLDYFADPCSTPHPIVWAKMKGFPFWPAKCLRIVNGHADVRFFGTHDKYLMQLSQVYRISRKNPGGSPKKAKNSSRMTSYEESMAELGLYVINYENDYGVFKYYNEKTPLQPGKSSGRKGSKNKGKNVLEDSMDDDLNDINEQRPPQLNVSLLHDDATETKASILQTVPKPVENTVLCQMTFQEEVSSEISHQTTEEPDVEASSVTTELPAQISDKVRSTQSLFKKNSPGIAKTCSCSSNNAQKSQPSISSTPLITSTQSLNNDASCQNCNLENIFHRAAAQLFHVDDDVQIIGEDGRVPLAENMRSHLPGSRMFQEILYDIRPNLKNYADFVQSFIVQAFLGVAWDGSPLGLYGSRYQLFYSLCERLLYETERHKFENKRLKAKIAELEQKLQAQTKKINYMKPKYTKKIQELKVKFSNVTGELTRQVNFFKDNFVASKKKVQNNFKEIEDLKKELEIKKDLEQQIEDAKKQVTSVEDLQKCVEDLKKQLSVKEQVEQQLQETIIHNKEQMKQAVATKEATIKDLELKFSELKSQAEKEIIEANERVFEMKKNFDRVNLELNEMKKREKGSRCDSDTDEPHIQKETAFQRISQTRQSDQLTVTEKEAAFQRISQTRQSDQLTVTEKWSLVDVPVQTLVPPIPVPVLENYPVNFQPSQLVQLPSSQVQLIEIPISPNIAELLCSRSEINIQSQQITMESQQITMESQQIAMQSLQSNVSEGINNGRTTPSKRSRRKMEKDKKN